MEFTKQFEQVPEKIKIHLQEEGYRSSEFRMALRTELKPNATIPTIWLVLFSSELLLCNTHRTRWLWKRFRFAELDYVCLIRGLLGHISIKIVSIDTVLLPISKKIDEAVVVDFINTLDKTNHGENTRIIRMREQSSSERHR